MSIAPRHADFTGLAQGLILRGQMKPYRTKRKGRPWRVDHINPLTKKRTSPTFNTEREAWAYCSMMAGLKDRLRLGTVSPKEAAVMMAGCVLVENVIDEYERDMKARKLTAAHVRESVRVVKAAAAWCKWGTATQIAIGPAQQWLGTFSANTARNYRKLLRAFTAWLKGRNYLAYDPLEELKASRSTRAVRQKRAFSGDELTRLLSCDRIPGWRRLWYWCGARTGLRGSELARLRWRDIDFEVAVIRVTPDIGKANRTDEVPIPAKLLAELQLKRQAPATPIFRHKVHRRVFYHDLERAGIARETDAGKLYPSSLRKTYGTHLAMAGLDSQTRQMLMRHTDPRLTTDTYIDPTMIAKREGVARLDRDETEEQTA